LLNAIGVLHAARLLDHWLHRAGLLAGRLEPVRLHSVRSVLVPADGHTGPCGRGCSGGQPIASLPLMTGHARRHSGGRATDARHGADLAGGGLGKGALTKAVR
jgi:hypothetical protein